MGQMTHFWPRRRHHCRTEKPSRSVRRHDEDEQCDNARHDLSGHRMDATASDACASRCAQAKAVAPEEPSPTPRGEVDRTRANQPNSSLVSTGTETAARPESSRCVAAERLLDAGATSRPYEHPARCLYGRQSTNEATSHNRGFRQPLKKFLEA